MTELEKALDDLLRDVPGAAFAAVAGMDGLVVEQAPAAREELPEAVAELTRVLSIARRTLGDILSGGPLEHATLQGAELSLAIWIVTDEYYCLVGSESPVDMKAVRPAAQAAVEAIRGSLT